MIGKLNLWGRKTIEIVFDGFIKEGWRKKEIEWFKLDINLTVKLGKLKKNTGEKKSITDFFVRSYWKCQKKINNEAVAVRIHLMLVLGDCIYALPNLYKSSTVFVNMYWMNLLNYWDVVIKSANKDCCLPVSWKADS